MGFFNAINCIGGINKKIKELETNLHSLEFNMNTRSWEIARVCWEMVRMDANDIMKYLEKSSSAASVMYTILGQKFQGRNIIGFIYEVLRISDEEIKKNGK